MDLTRLTIADIEIHRDINASINIRNYGLEQLDNRNMVGTIGI